MLTSEHRTWLSSVAFLDVVNFSKRSIHTQLEIKQHLDNILAQYLSKVNKEDYILLDRGDGAAVCFLVEPEAAFFFAVSIRDILRNFASTRPDYEIRIGINLGPIKIIPDINGHPAPVGEGINCAARVMDFADSDEILVSRSFFEVIGCQSQEYAELFSYLGIRADKHVRQFELYEVIPPGSQKNQATAPIPQENRTPNESTPPPTVEHVFTVDNDDYNTIQHALLNALGPMAKILLNRELKRVSSQRELIENCCNFITDSDQKKQFLSHIRQTCTNDIQTMPVDSTVVIDPPKQHQNVQRIDETLEKIATRELSQFIGPIASMLVKKASKKAQNKDELINLLLETLADESEKKSFRSRMSA